MSAGRPSGSPPSPPSLVCLTPVKNEAWILERFLAATATWADAIVVADDGSDDGSGEIAAAHPKVVRVDNPATGYDEGARQRLLLETARRHVPGPRVLIALDADEALTADAGGTDEWARLLAAAPGTVLRFSWLNLLPPGERAWIPPAPVPFGFVDDGSEHGGQRIHSSRLPTPKGAPEIVHERIGVLHLQYLDWERMKAKQRWYQCWERLNHPDKRPIQIYRQYHRMDAPPPGEVFPAAPEWLAAYREAGIDLTAIRPQAAFSWDADVLAWLREQPAVLRRIDVWDAGWDPRAAALGGSPPHDPRSRHERLVLRWLAATQPVAHRRSTRLVQRALRPLGW